MKILMLSWEYPPKNVGELSNHVYNLSKSMSRLGHEVHIITCKESNLVVEDEAGVIVHRVIPYLVETDDFTKWVMHLNFAMIEAGINVINANGRFDIIHVHDWHSVYAAKTLKNSYKIPMVCTIHETEHSRNNGIRTEMQRYISSAEWMLTYDAWKVIACNENIKYEINNVFNVPFDKIIVIPTGEDSEESWVETALSTIKLYEAISEEARGTEWEVSKLKTKKTTVAPKKKKTEEAALEESAAAAEVKPKTKRTRKKADN